MELQNKKSLGMVSADEEQLLNRNILKWLFEFPDIPTDVGVIGYEFLPAKTEAMALSTIQSGYITKKYLYGGYQAEYNFKVIYRILPANSSEKRLQADEVLNAFGDWALKNYPDIGSELSVLQIDIVNRASAFAIYESGEEDHQILLKMTYERIDL